MMLLQQKPGTATIVLIQLLDIRIYYFLKHYNECENDKTVKNLDLKNNDRLVKV